MPAAPMPLRAARLRRALRDALGYDALAARNRARGNVNAAVAAEAERGPPFTPDEAYYVTHTIYPFLACRGCAFYQPSPAGPGRCRIVAGPIEPEGLCNLFSIRGTLPARARIDRAALRFGRGPPEKTTPLHALLLEVGRKHLYPDAAGQSLTLTDVAQSPVLRAIAREVALPEAEEVA